MNSRDYGLCVVCDRPILYRGARFCSPGCNFDFLANGVRLREDPVLPDPVSIAEPEPEPVVEVEPGPVVEIEPEPEPEPEPDEPAGFMSLTPPPDEPPVKRRRIYF